MWRRLYNRKGQSTGEYALVFAIILGAIVAMQTYVKRGIQGRVKSGTDYMARVTGEIEGYGDTTLDGGSLITQYDPYYYESVYDTARDSEVSDLYADGAVTVDVDHEDTSRAAGGYTQYNEAEDQF